jgi:hypothetical protein
MLGQQKYELPPEYIAYKDNSEQKVQLSGDFDNDGVKDLVVIASNLKSEEYNFVFVFLSRNYNLKQGYHFFPITNSIGYDLRYEKSVLKIGGCFGNGRYCETYKFKYYLNLSDLRLIGYDEQNLGNAMLEGIYFQSVNLLTNSIAIEQLLFNENTQSVETNNKVKKHISTTLITLANMDKKTIEYLNNLGDNYLK